MLQASPDAVPFKRILILARAAHNGHFILEYGFQVPRSFSGPTLFRRCHRVESASRYPVSPKTTFEGMARMDTWDEGTQSRTPAARFPLAYQLRLALEWRQRDEANG
jgi:hypothetical protein